jgi:hypothetical protein
MAEAHHLLHPDQIGGRPQRSAIDAALALAHDVEMGKSMKLITSTLFLDMHSAFNNVSATRLLHTMQQLGCPRPVRTWYSTFLSKGTIALSFDGQTDRQCPISTSIPQGSPASPILFLLYLHPLFDTLNTIHPNIWSPSYIDDVALVVQGKTREGNTRVLEVAAGTAFQWARDNTVAFDDAKSEMLHFHRARQDTITEEIKIWLPHGTVVEPGTKGGKKDVVRWIGIFFDRKLSFNHHICTKLASTRRICTAMCSLVRHETGLSPLATCQCYQACVIPRSDYGAAIWWNKQQNLE